jgi:hypothetical protein
MKLRRTVFEERIDKIAQDFEADFLAVQFMDAWIEKFGTKSMPTRSQISMLLACHPRITSYHFNTRTKINGIRGDMRRYRYKN